MVCPRCANKLPEGLWVVRVIDGYNRHVCSVCGYLDDRRVWVGGKYVGPPELAEKAVGGT